MELGNEIRTECKRAFASAKNNGWSDRMALDIALNVALASIPEPTALTDEQWDAICRLTKCGQFDGYTRVKLDRVLARLTAAPKSTKQERVTVTRMGASEHVFVEFDGKIIYQFDDHEDEENDAEFHAKRYAAGLRQELEETK